MLAKHQSIKVEHGTPNEVLELARFVLGDIELDPCSSPEFNVNVKASRFFTEADNGLERPWNAKTVWVNPPGKPQGSPRSLAPLFWSQFVHEFLLGHFESGLFLAFSLEQLATLQNAGYPIGYVPFEACILRKRLKFLTESGEAQGSPTHANAVILLTNDAKVSERFKEFASLGLLIRSYP